MNFMDLIREQQRDRSLEKQFKSLDNESTQQLEVLYKGTFAG